VAATAGSRAAARNWRPAAGPAETPQCAAVTPIALASGQCLDPHGIYLHETLESLLLQYIPEGCSPGRRWRTELPGAGHRPPPKSGVRFSRATLSLRRPLLPCNGRNQFHQSNQPILAVYLGIRQSGITPTICQRTCPARDRVSHRETGAWEEVALEFRASYAISAKPLL
jgi:hypothetical protein